MQQVIVKLAAELRQNDAKMAAKMKATGEDEETLVKAAIMERIAEMMKKGRELAVGGMSDEEIAEDLLQELVADPTIPTEIKQFLMNGRTMHQVVAKLASEMRKHDAKLAAKMKATGEDEEF